MAGRTSVENGKLGGRPKGAKSRDTLAKEAARELVRQMVTRELEPLISAQIANATGLKYLVTRDKKTGKFIRVGEAMAGNHQEETIEVWEKDPSVQAFTDLLNRAIDKPKEQEVEMKITKVTDISDRELASRLAAIQGALRLRGGSDE